jgi:hypothetical protein
MDGPVGKATGRLKQPRKVQTKQAVQQKHI